jgi:hypothetical protein
MARLVEDGPCCGARAGRQRRWFRLAAPGQAAPNPTSASRRRDGLCSTSTSSAAAAAAGPPRLAPFRRGGRLVRSPSHEEGAALALELQPGGCRRWRRPVHPTWLRGSFDGRVRSWLHLLAWWPQRRVRVIIARDDPHNECARAAALYMRENPECRRLSAHPPVLLSREAFATFGMQWSSQTMRRHPRPRPLPCSDRPGACSSLRPRPRPTTRFAGARIVGVMFRPSLT